MNFYVDNLNIYDLIWIHTILIIFLRIIIYFSICIYHISYLIILKINVSAYQIDIVSNTHIESVHHSLPLFIILIL